MKSDLAVCSKIRYVIKSFTLFTFTEIKNFYCLVMHIFSSHNHSAINRCICIPITIIATFFFFETTIESVIYAPYSGYIGSWDGAYYYYWVRSLLFDGDLNFANDIATFNLWPEDLKIDRLNAPTTPLGLVANKYTIGWSLLSLPWIILGHFLALAANLLSFSFPLDGYSPPYQLCIALGHLFYAVVSTIFSIATIKRVTNCSLSDGIYLLCWASSFMLLYQMAEITMAHGVTYFCLSTIYYFTITHKDKNFSPVKQWAIISIFSALLILCRPQAIVYLLYPAVIFIKDFILEKRNNKTVIASSAALFFTIISLQLLAWKILYGSFLLYSYKGESFIFADPNFISVLFSPFHGLFYWHPIFLIGLIGMIVWLINTRTILNISLTISFLLNLYLNASWHNWWFGAAFGSRAFECFLLPTALGISYLFTKHKNLYFRVAVFTLLLATAIWNINLTTLVIVGEVPLDRGVSISEIISSSLKFWLHRYHSIDFIGS